MKIFGALLILIAATSIGFQIAKKLRARPQQLRQMKVALQSLEAEIMFGQTPLGAAAQQLAAQLEEPISLFFAKFSELLDSSDISVKKAWDESLQAVLVKTAFQKQEIEVLKQFGTTLGQHDRYQQQQQIRLTLVHLEREELDARDRQQRYEKMVKSLAFLSGLLVVILLM